MQDLDTLKGYLDKVRRLEKFTHEEADEFWKLAKEAQSRVEGKADDIEVITGANLLVMLAEVIRADKKKAQPKTVEVDREAVRDTVRLLESRIIDGIYHGPVEVEIRGPCEKTVFRFPPDFIGAQRNLMSALDDYVAACHKTSSYKAMCLMSDPETDEHRNVVEVTWEACGQKGLVRLTPPHPREYIEDWDEEEDDG